MFAPRLRHAVLPAALALLVAGCGGGGEGLLTDRQANRLRADLEDARRAVDDEPQRCGQAREAAQRGAERAASLPSRVDRQLQKNLQDGFNHLVDQVNAECGRDREPRRTPTSEPTPSPTVTAEPTVEPTVTAEPTVTPDTGGTGADDDAGEDTEGVRQVGDQE